MWLTLSISSIRVINLRVGWREDPINRNLTRTAAKKRTSQRKTFFGIFLYLCRYVEYFVLGLIVKTIKDNTMCLLFEFVMTLETASRQFTVCNLKVSVHNPILQRSAADNAFYSYSIEEGQLT